MGALSYGLIVRGQYPAGDDMAERFEEVKAQVRLADRLGFSDLLTGMHYASAPLQQYQQLPLLHGRVCHLQLEHLFQLDD